MATTIITRETARSVGTAVTTVGSVVAASHTRTILSLRVVNRLGLTGSGTTAAPITATVSLYDGTNDTYMIVNILLPPGTGFTLTGGDGKDVMIAGDSIRAFSNVASSLDVIVSFAELY